MAFHVGQKVECIRPSSYTIWQGETDVAVGNVYTVRAVFVRSWRGECYETLLVEEISNPLATDGLECGFIPSRFRPLTDRKSEVSFTMGADPESEKYDNRRRVKVRS